MKNLLKTTLVAGLMAVVGLTAGVTNAESGSGWLSVYKTCGPSKEVREGSTSAGFTVQAERPTRFNSNVHVHYLQNPKRRMFSVEVSDVRIGETCILMIKRWTLGYNAAAEVQDFINNYEQIERDIMKHYNSFGESA